VEPEVAGGLGPSTVMDGGAVTRLEYRFDGWLGDELLEVTPCFVVTERIAAELERAGLTGFVLAEVLITTSEVFRELYPGRQLPPFRWLKIVGGPSDDLARDHLGVLAVSRRALELLERLKAIAHADIEPVDSV
jgi:hypothetical protein